MSIFSSEGKVAARLLPFHLRRESRKGRGCVVGSATERRGRRQAHGGPHFKPSHPAARRAIV